MVGLAGYQYEDPEQDVGFQAQERAQRKEKPTLNLIRTPERQEYTHSHEDEVSKVAIPHTPNGKLSGERS